MAEATFSYAVNDFVVVQNLQEKTEYNDKVAVVKELLPEKSRLAVKLVASDKPLNVKEANLRSATDAELKAQLPAAFQKFRVEQLEAMLSAKGASVPSGGDKDALIEAAVTAKVVPEVVKKRVDPDELVDLPGGGQMTRAQMQEQARQLDAMTPLQMREQLRMLTSRSPAELRAQSPQMRQMSDEQIQQQIKQLQMFVNNPRLKKLQVEALRTGDFSKLNDQAVNFMSDSEIRANAQKQLEEFRKDPKAFRAQFMPDQESLSDTDVEDMLKQQSEIDGETLRAMRNASATGQVDMSKMSDEQWKKNSEMQLKMFKSNPRKFREQMEKQTPEARNLSDEQIEMQLEAMSKMSKKEFEDLQKMAQGGGGGGAGGMGGGMMNPSDMDKMTGEQLKSMFKMQSDMFKRDPQRFKQMVPQFSALSDDMIQGQLDMMANMDPMMLKMLMGFQSRFGTVFNRVKAPLDAISGGRGQQILGFFMLFLAFLVLYYIMGLFFRLLAFFFPTTFGYSGAATPKVQQSVPVDVTNQRGAAAPQVDLNVDDDAFFQDNEDL